MAGGQFDAGVHRRAESAFGVRQLNPDLCGTSLWVEGRINEGDLAQEQFAGKGVDGDTRFLTGMHQVQVLLEHIRHQPQHR